MRIAQPNCLALKMAIYQLTLPRPPYKHQLLFARPNARSRSSCSNALAIRRIEASDSPTRHPRAQDGRVGAYVRPRISILDPGYGLPGSQGALHHHLQRQIAAFMNNKKKQAPSC